MNIDIILNEFNRLDNVKENTEFTEFILKKIDESDFSLKDDPEQFLKELNEEWIEEYDLDELMEIYNSVLEKSSDNITSRFINAFLNEKFKKVVRGGKVKRKRVCRDGYVVKGGKCVKQKASEKRKLSKAQKKGAKKRKIKKSASTRKRKKSTKRGKNIR